MMISRRALMGGLSMLPLAAGLTGCAARALGSPIPSSSGLVGPGSTWNGTPLSGGVPPVDPPRLTAKPAVHWWQPSELRMSSNLIIGVDADALGGVANVEFWVEGAVQRITQSLLTDKDANGQTRTRLGYFITLDAQAFKAISSTGEVRIFATAFPIDGTMQPRTIGYDRARPGSANGTDANRKMSVFPRATPSDFAKTVGTSGADFTNLNDAIAAAKAANAEAAEFTVTTSGFYELSTANTPLYAGAKGFHVIKAAPGVEATIGRAQFPAGQSPTWAIDPKMECLEFRGSGITLDFRNFSTIGDNSYSRGCRFNGCTMTNSIGARDTLYWNKGTGPNRGSAVPAYIEDCTIRYVNAMQGHLMAVGNKALSITGADMWSGTHFVANNYVHSATPGFFREAELAMDIAYTGTGSATIDKTGGSDGGSLVLKVNGAIVKNYPLGTVGADQWFNITDIVADIDAMPDWSSRGLAVAATKRASALLGHGFGSTQGFSNQPVTGTPVQLDAWFDDHGDVIQMFTDNGAGIRENAIYRGNTLVGIGDGNWSSPGISTLRFDSHMRDIIITDCCFGGANTSADIGSSTESHVVIRNTIHEGAVTLRGGGAIDAYSRIEQSVFGQTGWSISAGPTPYIYKDCYLAYGFQGPEAFAAAPNSGNTLLNGQPAANFRLNTLVQNADIGDFRPRPAMPVKPRLNLRDGLALDRAALDTIGAWALGKAAPTWPF